MLNYLKVLIAAACLMLVMTSPAAASRGLDDSGPTSTGQQEMGDRKNIQAAKDIQDQTAQKRKEITAEALAAIEETEKAVHALDKGNKKHAIAALERATGKLELILAREPELALAPVDVSVTTYDLYGVDIEGVKKARKQAEQLLEDGRIQNVRDLLNNLASETVISVSNIPLATYPDAIKRAAKHIDEGKNDQAKHILQAALNTLVVTEKVIPLPVADAKVALQEAEKLAEKSGRAAGENTQLSRLLMRARSHLELAQALGYGTEADFKALYTQMDEIEEKTRSGKHGQGFFTKIRSSLQELSESVQPNNKRIASHPAQNK